MGPSLESGGALLTPPAAPVPLSRVQHQKLHLAVDLKAQALIGYTELDIHPPTADAPRTLGLHACGLHISSITVDSASAKFQQLTPPTGKTRVRSLQQIYASAGGETGPNVGETVYRDYVRALQEEAEPNLLIDIPNVIQEAGATHEPTDEPQGEAAEIAKNAPPDGKHPDVMGMDNQGVEVGESIEAEKADGKPPTGGDVLSKMKEDAEKREKESKEKKGDNEQGDLKVIEKQEDAEGEAGKKGAEDKKESSKKKDEAKGQELAVAEKLLRVRIHFQVKNPKSGVYFHNDVMHTNNQLCRARCWFPCADSSEHPHSFELEYIADSHVMAISSGELVKQAFTDSSEQQKLWLYRVALPTTPALLFLAVGPFVVLPDVQAPVITHFCMPGHLKKLRQTVHFLHTAFSTYEEYLGLPFPFSSYVQVFLDAEAAYETAALGLSMSQYSAHLLVDDRVIDQTAATRIKLAHYLARQWFGVFITPDSSADVWLVDGLAAFLTDVFVRRHLGNNELLYRRYKENEAVCLADVDGAAPLSVPSLDDADKKGGPTVRIEELERSSVRKWKAKAVLCMLEKQVGPDAFKKCIQELVTQAKDGRRPGRAVSMRDFQTILRKVGGQDKRALKEFFVRWVKSPGCPRVDVAFNYIRRRNLLEVALVRTATAVADPAVLAVSSGGKAAADLSEINPESGWPGSLPIRVQELDGSFDHLVALSGDKFDKAELQCHSKLTAAKKQTQKEGQPPKRKYTKGAKKKKEAEAEEAEFGGPLKLTAGADGEQTVDSAVLWVRINPDSDVLADVHVHQTETMWISQLERDRDVVAQVQAITALASLARPTFAAMNALHNCMADSRVYCHVRAEAARALGRTAKESTNWAGLDMLLKFYRGRRYDADIGLPKPNDFSDFRDYFLDQAIPGAVASVRGADGYAPLEAVEFLLELLKYNDNSANAFSDGNWLAAVIEAVGAAKYSPQTKTQHLPKILKQLDKHLQYEKLMPSHNHVVTISSLRTLARLACQMPRDKTLKERLQVLLLQHTQSSQPYKVRQAAFCSLMDLEKGFAGSTAALQVALKVADGREAPKVVAKLLTHASRLWTAPTTADVTSPETASVVSQLQLLVVSKKTWSHVRLRHVAFMILQQIEGRPATLYRMYTKRGIDLPQDEVLALPPETQAKAPPSGKEDGHVPLMIRIRRAGSESVMEPSKTEGAPKILVRIPRGGAMPAPSSTQDSLKVRLKLPGHGRSSALGPDVSEGPTASVRQRPERSESAARRTASGRSGQVTARSSQLLGCHPEEANRGEQEASTPLRLFSVKDEPTEEEIPVAAFKVPRPAIQKTRSLLPRVPRRNSVFVQEVEAQQGEQIDLDINPPKIEEGALTPLQEEGKLKESAETEEVLVGVKVASEEEKLKVEAEETALKERYALLEAELAAVDKEDHKDDLKEEGEIEEGEIMAPETMPVKEPKEPLEANDGAEMRGKEGAEQKASKKEKKNKKERKRKKGEEKSKKGEEKSKKGEKKSKVKKGVGDIIEGIDAGAQEQEAQGALPNKEAFVEEEGEIPINLAGKKIASEPLEESGGIIEKANTERKHALPVELKAAEKADDQKEKPSTPAAERHKMEPTVPQGLKLKLVLKKAVGADKQGGTQATGKVAPPGGEKVQGVKQEEGQPATEAVGPSVPKGKASGEEDKRKGLSEEEYKRQKREKKEEKRRRKEEKKRRKSEGKQDGKATEPFGDPRPVEEGLEGFSGGDVRPDVKDTQTLEPVYVELRAEPEPHAGHVSAEEDRGEIKSGGRPEADKTEAALDLEVEKTGSVLGKRGREETQVPSLGGVQEAGEATPHREEESKRRRTVESAGGEPVVGFKGLDEVELDIEGVKREKRPSPEKQQLRLQKIRERLGKAQGSPAAEKSRKAEEGAALEKPSARIDASGALKDKLRKVRAADLDTQLERAVLADERATIGAASRIEERKGVRAESEKPGGLDGERMPKVALDKTERRNISAERGEETGERFHKDEERGKVVDTDEPRERKRKKSKDEKGAAKQKKKIKSLDALPDVASGPKREFGQPKEEPKVEPIKAPAPEEQVKKPFKIKFKLKP